MYLSPGPTPLAASRAMTLLGMQIMMSSLVPSAAYQPFSYVCSYCSSTNYAITTVNNRIVYQPTHYSDVHTPMPTCIECA